MGGAPTPAGNQADSSAGQTRLSFGAYQVDVRSGELTGNGKRVYLQRQPLEVLRMLLEHPGEMVTRDELRQRLWPGDTFVDFDHGLNKAVQKLRIALGDSSEAPQFVETLPRRGYRFIAPVQSGLESPAALPGAVSSSAIPRRWRRGSLVIAAIAVVAMAAAYWLLSRRTERPTAPTPQVSRLVVLPFENLSGDAAQEYFSDGMTDEMISELNRLDPEGLAVIARTSAMRYKRSGKTMAEIGRDLGVQYVLEGSVRRDAGRVRISVRLIQARDETPLWAGSYERELSGVMPIQQEIAANVAREIGLKLRAGAASPPAAKSIPPEAYDAFLRGLYLLHSGRNDAVFESVQHFQNAVAHAPDYALAYAWLAFAYNRLSSGDHVPPKRGYALAKAAALRAIEIDPTLPEAHAALGFILRSYEWDWQGAEQELRRAVAVGPNTPVAHQVYGLYLSAVGRHEEAIAALNRAAALDPLSPVVASNRASAYGYARRFEEAKAMWQGRGDISLSRSWPHILIMNGKYREALSLLEAAPKDAQRWELVSGKAQAYAGLGRTREARAILEQLKSRPEARNILSPHIALIHAQLGETDEALRWLEMAVEEHSARLVYLKVDPGWDQLRGDPRFHALLRRMNFTDPLSAP